jgi:adenine C2-methylase RlmN of 23S rRNA A2503 and tRNA A37
MVYDIWTGMGEPLYNYRNVLRALKLMNGTFIISYRTIYMMAMPLLYEHGLFM